MPPVHSPALKETSVLPRGEEREEIRNSVRKGKIGGAFLFFGDFYHRDVDLERRKYSNLKAFYGEPGGKSG